MVVRRYERLSTSVNESIGSEERIQIRERTIRITIAGSLHISL